LNTLNELISSNPVLLLSKSNKPLFAVCSTSYAEGLCRLMKIEL